MECTGTMVVLETNNRTTNQILQSIERAGRTCYKSESSITYESAEKFVQMIIKRGHESVLEHISLSFRIICDRGVSHELVRHRIASYSQESTRYVNYAKRGIQFIDPAESFDKMQEDPMLQSIWYNAMLVAEDAYIRMIENGASPELARSVLPNSLKTELVMTCNLREWRHFLKLRTAYAAHPQMRKVAKQIHSILALYLPPVFADIGI